MTTLEDVVSDDHPLRAIRVMVDAALEEMSEELEALYASGGRPSVAPEYLLRAQLAEILLRDPLGAPALRAAQIRAAAALVRRPPWRLSGVAPARRLGWSGPLRGGALQQRADDEDRGDGEHDQRQQVDARLEHERRQQDHHE
ncbi:MAG: hypothetical protein QM323_09915, partial [Acidobacteriota bacterium]|nr:hypothetical protein [Acidobacteriota bacterium]